MNWKGKLSFSLYVIMLTLTVIGLTILPVMIYKERTKPMSPPQINTYHVYEVGQSIPYDTIALHGQVDGYWIGESNGKQVMVGMCGSYLKQQ